MQKNFKNITIDGKLTEILLFGSSKDPGVKCRFNVMEDIGSGYLQPVSEHTLNCNPLGFPGDVQTNGHTYNFNPKL